MEATELGSKNSQASGPGTLHEIPDSAFGPYEIECQMIELLDGGYLAGVAQP